MRKFNLLVLLLPLITLPACSKERDYYEITIHTRNGDIVKYYPTNTYPTIDGWKYGYQMTTEEIDRYTPSLQKVTKNAEYTYKDFAVSINNVPGDGTVTKYYSYGSAIDFSEYSISYQRYSDRPVTCYGDAVYEYRFRATFTNIYDEFGNLVNDVDSYFTYGSSVSYTGTGSSSYYIYPYSYSFDHWIIYTSTYTTYSQSMSMWESYTSFDYSDITLAAYYNWYYVG